MKLMKRLNHKILVFLALLGFVLHAHAQKNWEDIFTVYMLDPDGHFMTELDAQIQRMVPLSSLNPASANEQLMGNIVLKYEGAITDDVDYYTISRPLQGNKRADIDSTEEYQLVVFKKENILGKDKSKTGYSFSEDQKRWFTQTYGTTVYQNQNPLTYGKTVYQHRYPQTMILSRGVLNMLQIDNTRPTVNQGNPHQFMEMIGGVARQADFIKRLEGNPNIIRLEKQNADVLLAIPLLELYDLNLRDYLFSQPDIALTEVLKHMALLARAMEYMHERNIAHGDIDLKSLLVKLEQKMKVVFANFERSSKVDAVSASHTLGRKKFTFSNNVYHAPEIRFPTGTPKEHWRYTSATVKGDIWSFGFMLAAVLSLYQEAGEAVEKLQVSQPFYQYYADQNGKPIYEPEELRDIAIVSPLQQYMKKASPITAIPSVGEVQLQKLTKLINSATQFDPERRPSATQIAKTLEQILEQP